MKCPKCGEEIIYEDITDDVYGDDTYSRRWRVTCPKCPFEGYLWETYRLESEEWDNEENLG